MNDKNINLFTIFLCIVVFPLSSCIPTPIKEGKEKTELEYNDELVSQTHVDTFKDNESPNNPPGNPDVQISKLEIDFYDVLRTSCFNCHGQGSAYGNFNVSVSELVYAGFVFPGNPENSKIYFRLKGSGASQGRGAENMPVGMELENIDRQKIYDFISSIDISQLEAPTSIPTTPTPPTPVVSPPTPIENTTGPIQVIQNYCISCHTGYHNKWSAYTEQDYINQGLIQPGRPEASLLLNITKYNPYSDVEVMPKGDNGFNENHFFILDDWVKAMQTP